MGTDYASIQVWSDHATPVGEPGETITVTALSGGTVFYGDRQVSSGSHLGSLTVGQSVDVTVPTNWLRSGSSSTVLLNGVSQGIPASQLPASVVTNSQPLAAGAGNFPLLMMVPAQRTPGTKSGFSTNSTVYNGTQDPLVSMGHQAPAPTTFTATSNGTTTLSAVSTFAGLAEGTVLSDTGGKIPFGTTVVSTNPGAGTMVVSNAVTAGVGTITAADYTSAIQLEYDWDCGPGAGQPHITEWYWQIIKPDGTSRRPFYGQYDRTHGRMVQWFFMVGDGTSDIGTQPAAFNFNWDDDTSPEGGAAMVVFTPNHVDLYPVFTGGIAADHNQLSIRSAAGKESILSMTYNGQDASFAHSTLYMNTAGAGQVNVSVGAAFNFAMFTPTLTQPGISMVGGIGFGDGAAFRGAMWGATGVPANTLGNNGDWCISDNGHLYSKAAGAWAQKI